MSHRFFFFAGGDYVEGQGNTFTSNFIRYFSHILGPKFSVIKGIYQHPPLLNVIWALNRAQEPVKTTERNRILASSLEQVIASHQNGVERLVLVSSSYGSVVAAQVACCLAGHRMQEGFQGQSIDVALGASMVSKKSGLYRKLQDYQDRGIIGTLLYDELQDEGDNSNGIGGRTKPEAFGNGLGICFPFLSRQYHGPSFLNNHPVTGHLHRVRAQSVQKAKDFVQSILIDYQLGGDIAMRKAQEALEHETRNVALNLAPGLKNRGNI